MDTLDIIAAILILIAWGIITWRFLPRLWFPQTTVKDKEIVFLHQPEVRGRLSGFLRANMILGDADIRDGVALPVVPLERLEPLAILLGHVRHLIPRLANPNADGLYLRGKGGELILTGIDLTDLLDASRAMQRMAESIRYPKEETQ